MMKRLIALVVVLVFALTGIVGGSIAANRDRADHPGCVVISPPIGSSKVIYIDLDTEREISHQHWRTINRLDDPAGKFKVFFKGSLQNSNEYKLEFFLNNASKSFIGDYSFTAPAELIITPNWSDDSSIVVFTGKEDSMAASTVFAFIVQPEQHRITSLPFLPEYTVGWMDNNKILSSIKDGSVILYSVTSTSWKLVSQPSQPEGTALISPRHNLLAYLREYNGQSFIDIINSNGDLVSHFNDISGNIIRLLWSPNESTLAIFRFESNVRFIDIAHLDGQYLSAEMRDYFYYPDLLPRWTSDNRGILSEQLVQGGASYIVYVDANTGETLANPHNKLPTPIMRTKNYNAFVFQDGNLPRLLKTTLKDSQLRTYTGEPPLIFGPKGYEQVLGIDWIGDKTDVLWARLDGSEKHKVTIDDPVTSFQVFNSDTSPYLLIFTEGKKGRTAYLLDVQNAMLTQVEDKALQDGIFISYEENITKSDLVNLQGESLTVITKYAVDFRIEAQFDFPLHMLQISGATISPNLQAAIVTEYMNSGKTTIFHIARQGSKETVQVQLDDDMASINWTLDSRSFILSRIVASPTGNYLEIRQYSLDGRLLFLRTIADLPSLAYTRVSVSSCAPESLN